MNDDLGKRAELKIKDWLNRPDHGYCFDRIPDQMNGFFGSKNPCDFILYKHPNMYYIESKATWKERFDFSMITPHQRGEMLKRSKIDGVYGLVIVLFASVRRAFVFKIDDIDKLEFQGTKSLNVNRVDFWTIPYKEIKTVPSSRKLLLDYTGEIEEYIP